MVVMEAWALAFCRSFTGMIFILGRGRKPLCSKYWYKLSNDGFFPSAQIAMCSSSHPVPL
uniref:Uncharacterized protein n=1 Tax=Vitis vinifera TaxID=29760 RepID=F6HRH1_VITVI